MAAAIEPTKQETSPRTQAKQDIANLAKREVFSDNEESDNDDSAIENDPEAKAILKINWGTITPSTAASEKSIVGVGSFGTVLRGSWRHNGQVEDVAVKVVTNARGSDYTSRFNYDLLYKSAVEEVKVILKAQNGVRDSGFEDCTIKVWGIARGKLKGIIPALANCESFHRVVGIVMRYEGYSDQYLTLIF
jgi:hypothetical protein